MSYNPFRDAKFLTLLLDTVISLALYFAGRYGSPDLFEAIKFGIGAIQPIFVALIVGFYQRDQATLMNGLPLRHLRNG